MKKIKHRRIMFALVALLLLASCCSVFLVLGNNVAFVEGQEYLSPERYTASDKLLLPDGSESNKTIQEFAAE